MFFGEQLKEYKGFWVWKNETSEKNRMMVIREETLELF